LLLALRIGGGGGGFPDHRKVLAAAARVLGGNLPARHGGWLLCQFAQKQDVSLHAHWAAISDSRDSVTFIELMHVKPILIWTGVIVGTGIAFLLEWRYARRLSADACNSYLPATSKEA
jgi:hypothetical protein